MSEMVENAYRPPLSKCSHNEHDWRVIDLGRRVCVKCQMTTRPLHEYLAEIRTALSEGQTQKE